MVEGHGNLYDRSTTVGIVPSIDTTKSSGWYSDTVYYQAEISDVFSDIMSINYSLNPKVGDKFSYKDSALTVFEVTNDTIKTVSNHLMSDYYSEDQLVLEGDSSNIATTDWATSSVSFTQNFSEFAFIDNCTFITSLKDLQKQDEYTILLYEGDFNLIDKGFSFKNNILLNYNHNFMFTQIKIFNIETSEIETTSSFNSVDAIIGYFFPIENF